MKECFKKIGCKEIPKFTVVIAGKRHHIRFFPDVGKGDRNGNPLPGTLVETGCTHPFEFDFYLCSHVAIKGTARPIHYQCILNEGEWLAAELQSFIFEHSYHYVRSTTPVSLHPAVYYAHLAADRSRAHLNDNPVSSGKKESKADQQSSTGSSSKNVEIAPLMAMQNVSPISSILVLQSLFTNITLGSWLEGSHVVHLSGLSGLLEPFLALRRKDIGGVQGMETTTRK
jgi:eukaryotic translation initiation factor 2C